MRPIQRSAGAAALLVRGAPPVLALGVATAFLLGMRPGTEPEVGTTAPANPDLMFETPPLDLPSAADHHASPQPPAVEFAIDRSVRVRGFRVEVVDASGDLVPERVLHHVKLLDRGRRDLFHPFMMRLLGAGHETREFRLPFPYALRLDQGQELLLTAMLHNPFDQAFEGVRVRVHIETVNREWPGRIDLMPFFAHVTEASEPSSYDLPPGRSTRSWEGSPVVSGRIVGFSGHLHQYGTELIVEDLTEGKELWRGRANLDEEGHVISIPRKVFRLGSGVRMRADHVYRMTAVYDNPTGAVIPGGGMGTVGGLLRPERGTVWPAADPDHPLYVADLASELDPYSHHREAGAHAHPGHRHEQP